MLRIYWIIGLNTLRELLRKKDIYVFLLLVALLLGYLAQASVFGHTGLTRYVKEAGLGMVFIFSLLICLPFSCRLLPAELRDKTIYPLLAKPVSRQQVLRGKYCGAVLASVGSFTVLFAAFCLFTVRADSPALWPVYLQTYWCGVLLFALLSSLGIWLSVTVTFSAAVTLTFFVYCLMSWFSVELRQALYSFSLPGMMVYYLLPHVELLDLRQRLIHGWPVLPARILLILSGYAVVYIGGVLALAQRAFSRKVL